MIFYHALFAAYSAVRPMTIIDHVNGRCFVKRQTRSFDDAIDGNLVWQPAVGLRVAGCAA